MGLLIQASDWELQLWWQTTRYVPLLLEEDSGYHKININKLTKQLLVHETVA